MLLEVGFDAVHVWLRPMRQQGSAAASALSANGSIQPKGKGAGGRRGNRRQGGGGRRGGAAKDDSDDAEDRQSSEPEEEQEEEGFKEWLGPATFTSEELLRINLGWTAYLVGVVNGRAEQTLRLTGAQAD